MEHYDYCWREINKSKRRFNMQSKYRIKEENGKFYPLEWRKGCLPWSKYAWYYLEDGFDPPVKVWAPTLERATKMIEFVSGTNDVIYHDVNI
mgnify:CR=1 FL=1